MPTGARHIAAALALIVVVAFVWAVLSFVPGFSARIGVVTSASLPATVRAADARAALLTSAAIVLGALLLALAMRQPIGVARRGIVLVAAALPSGVFGFSAALGLSAACGAARIVSVPALGAGMGGLALGVLLVACSALGEELMFRGVLQPVLARSWGSAAALAVSALAFTFLHYLGGWRDPVSLLNIFAAAIWFGLLALRTGGVLAPLLAHFGWNCVEALLFGAAPNPGIDVYGSLIDVDIVGAPQLGGSPDGMNASLTTSVVLAGLIAPLAIRRRIGDARQVGGKVQGQSGD